MTRASNELFEEKMAMVYNYNHASSLFIRAAGSELKKNNLYEALDILNQGIKNFPKYPTAYILLGKVHLELGNFDLAENAFRKGCSLTGSSGSLSYYLGELENIKSRHPNINQSRRISFFEKSEIHDKELSNMEFGQIHEKASDTNESESSDNSATDPIDDNLEDVARKISSAKIEISGQNNIPANSSSGEQKSDNKDNNLIVSETLAKIYISQGKFHEAIDVYKKLQIKSPDKKEFYQMKIDEIQKQLGDLDWD